MIKTIEIAPDILAKALAHHLFDEFGTIRDREGQDVLFVTDVVDLYNVIKEYLNR
jgi:hypothetical protein